MGPDHEVNPEPLRARAVMIIVEVTLARGLVNQPDLIFADEPTGNLDHHASGQLLELIRKLNQEFNQTFVIVTHSQRVAGQLDRVMELVDGKVGPTRENLVL